MSGISMGAFESLPDVLGTFRFNLLMTVPSFGNEATRDIALRCQQASIPGVQVEQMLVGLHGHERNFAGRTVYSKTMAVTFVETTGGATSRYLRAWKEAARGSNSGNGAYSNVYGTDAVLEVLDTSGAVALSYRIYTCWPTDIPEVQLDGSGSNPFLQPCTFSFDRFHLDGVEDSPFGEAPSI